MDSLHNAISEHLTSLYPIRPTLFFTILTIFDANDTVPAKRQGDVKGVEEDRDKQATLCRGAGGLRPDGACRSLGELALPSRRMGAQLRRDHDDAEQAVRGASRPDAGGPQPQEVARMARGGTC